MKLYYNLYANDSIRKDKLKILSQIDDGKFVLNKYLLILSKNEKNHLEFFDSAYVSQKMLEKEDIFVVGLADSYGGAVSLVEKIVNEVLTVTGGTNIRGYLLNQQMEYEKRNG